MHRRAALSLVLLLLLAGCSSPGDLGGAGDTLTTKGAMDLLPGGLRSNEWVVKKDGNATAAGIVATSERYQAMCLADAWVEPDIETAMRHFNASGGRLSFRGPDWGDWSSELDEQLFVRKGNAFWHARYTLGNETRGDADAEAFAKACRDEIVQFGVRYY